MSTFPQLNPSPSRPSLVFLHNVLPWSVSEHRAKAFQSLLDSIQTCEDLIAPFNFVSRSEYSTHRPPDIHEVVLTPLGTVLVLGSWEETHGLMTHLESLSIELGPNPDPWSGMAWMTDSRIFHTHNLSCHNPWGTFCTFREKLLHLQKDNMEKGQPEGGLWDALQVRKHFYPLAKETGGLTPGVEEMLGYFLDHHLDFSASQAFLRELCWSVAGDPDPMTQETAPLGGLVKAHPQAGLLLLEAIEDFPSFDLLRQELRALVEHHRLSERMPQTAHSHPTPRL